VGTAGRFAGGAAVGDHRHAGGAADLHGARDQRPSGPAGDRGDGGLVQAGQEQDRAAGQDLSGQSGSAGRSVRDVVFPVAGGAQTLREVVASFGPTDPSSAATCRSNRETHVNRQPDWATGSRQGADDPGEPVGGMKQNSDTRAHRQQSTLPVDKQTVPSTAKPQAHGTIDGWSPDHTPEVSSHQHKRVQRGAGNCSVSSRKPADAPEFSVPTAGRAAP
jgi:hypothetical protein